MLSRWSRTPLTAAFLASMAAAPVCRVHVRRLLADLASAFVVHGVALLLHVVPLSATQPLAWLLGRVLHITRYRRRVVRANARTLPQPLCEQSACTQLVHGMLLAMLPQRRDEELRDLLRLSQPCLNALVTDLKQGGVILLSAHIGPVRRSHWSDICPTPGPSRVEQTRADEAHMPRFGSGSCCQCYYCRRCRLKR